jgi:hypothetical protein
MDDPDIYQCGHCSCQKPLSFFTGGEGQVYKMCAKCRETDGHHMSHEEQQKREHNNYQAYLERMGAAVSPDFQDNSSDEDNVDVRDIIQQRNMATASNGGTTNEDIQDMFNAFTNEGAKNVITTRVARGDMVIVWKDVEEFPNYEVSNTGDVRNKTSQRVLSLYRDPNGYAYATMNAKSRLVHRIVAKAFIPNPDNKATVNHKNHDRHDNSIGNLEWQTSSEQNLHKRHKGFKTQPNTSAIASEEWRPWPKDPEHQVSNRGRIKRGDTFVTVYTEDRYQNVVIVTSAGRKTTLFHRIVAETWCPNWTDDCVINHIDGNKQNNFPENLECTTQSDNIRKAYATNEAMNARMRKVRQHLADGSFDTTHVSLREASRVSGMNDGSIAYACKHGTEHGGYLWQFADAVPDPVPTGAKECSSCRKRFPEDQFVGLRGKPVKMCPACRAKTSKGAERDNKKLEEETPEGTKRCSGHCRQVKSLTEFVSTINQTETKLCSSCREYQASRHKKK